MVGLDKDMAASCGNAFFIYHGKDPAIVHLSRSVLCCIAPRRILLFLVSSSFKFDIS